MRFGLVWTVVSCVAVACGDDSGGGDTTTSDAATTGGPTAGPSSGTMPPTTDDTTGMPPGSSDDGGSSSSTSGGGGESESGSSSSDTGGGGLSFEADIWPVLTMVREPPLSGASDSCSGTNGCHAGGGAGGLALPDASTAYDNLIDAPSSSTLCAGMLEVVAGEPDNSCFVVFYEDRLRDSLGWVEQSETDLIRDWVEAGAAP